MTNPAEKKQLNTHGHETRRFTHVKPTKPALEATKPMGTAAEKIRQVIKKVAERLYIHLPHFENIAAAEEMAKYVAKPLLDAIIAEMEDANARYHKTNNVWHLQQVRRDLKEARTSLTNSTHE